MPVRLLRFARNDNAKSVIARSEATKQSPPRTHEQAKRDCFASLAMTLNYLAGLTSVAWVNWSARAV
jgi:hypothetical protein